MNLYIETFDCLFAFFDSILFQDIPRDTTVCWFLDQQKPQLQSRQVHTFLPKLAVRVQLHGFPSSST